jgi:hypothetical protein
MPFEFLQNILIPLFKKNKINLFYPSLKNQNWIMILTNFKKEDIVLSKPTEIKITKNHYQIKKNLKSWKF